MTARPRNPVQVPSRGRRWLGAALAVLLVVVLGPASTRAQVAPTAAEEWRRTVPNHDGVMMDIDANDNVYVVGYSVVGDTVPTRRYSPEGTLVWERPYPTPGERARPSWLATDPAGNVVVSAFLIVGASNPAGWVVYKYDPAGNLLWKDVISVPFGRTVRVETDAAGNAYVVGRMGLLNQFGSLTIDTVTIKYAPDGTRLWTRVFDGGGANTSDEPSSLALSPDGNRVATVGQSGGLFFAVVYDAAGNEVGRTVQPQLGTAWDAAFGPQNVLYVGASRWTPETSTELTVVRLGANVAPVWIRSFADGVYAYRIAVDGAGDVVVAGVESPAATFFLDWVTLKLSPDGTRLWAQSYNQHPSLAERPWFLELDTAGNIYVTGEGGPPLQVGGMSYLQLVTLQYAPGGVLQWAAFNGNGRGVAVRPANRQNAVFVTSLYEMLTLKLTNTGPPPPPPPPPPPTTTTTSIPPPAPPAAPTSLQVSGTWRTQVRLAWTNNTADQTAVAVERCRGAGCTSFVNIGQAGGAATTYVDSRLTRNTTYRYRVQAIGPTGSSAYSNVVTARTRP